MGISSTKDTVAKDDNYTGTKITGFVFLTWGFKLNT